VLLYSAVEAADGVVLERNC